MKQLYATLEDKERELREFIRNYEQVQKSKVNNNKIVLNNETNKQIKLKLLSPKTP